MAEKRMFSNKITDSDSFSDMNLSAQALYFHLNMHADDDGIVNNPRRIQKAIGATDADFAELVEKRFLLIIDGVTIVKHWRMNNTIREDRKQKSAYPDILTKLKIKENGAYTLADLNQATKSQPSVNQATDERQANVGQVTGSCRANDRQMSGECLTSDGQVTGKRQANVGVDKNSIDKNSIDISDYARVEDQQPKTEEIKTPSDYFEEFWQVYPNKSARIMAQQAWAELNPDPETVKQIIAAVKLHREKNPSWARERGRYIPSPANYIRDKRWLDELPEEIIQPDTQKPPDNPQSKNKFDFPQRERDDDFFAELERRKIKKREE